MRSVVSITHWVRKILSIETLFALVCAAIMSWQLFFHPVVGLADNSDFLRLLFQVGLAPNDYPGGFEYFALHYHPFPRQAVEYLSSQVLLCEAAIFIHRLFGSGDFDLRYLGFANAAAYLAGLFLLARGLSLPQAPKTLFLAAAVFLLVDVRIVSYFNSFYSESAAVVFLLCTLGCMLLLGRERAKGWRLAAGLSAFLLLSLLLAFSKAQNLILLVPLWLFGACFATRRIHSFPMRLTWIGVSALLLLGGLWWGVSSRAYAHTKGMNIQTVWHEEIKPHSTDQRRDLKELTATSGNITMGRIAWFYLRHPARYLQLLERRALKSFTHLAYGNFTKDDALYPYQQSDKFDGWWRLKERFFPRNILFIAGVLAGTAAGGGLLFIKHRSHRLSHIGLVAATLAAMAAAAFLVSATFEANGPEKHLFLFNVLFDLTAALGLLLLWAAAGLTTEAP